MKKIIFAIILLLFCTTNIVFAANVIFKDIRFNSNNLVITLSIDHIKADEIVDALKRGLEGKIEYTVQIVEDPALPLMPKEIIKTVTVKKKVKFDFFSKVYLVSQSSIQTFFYSDESVINELFNNKQIVIEDVYKFRKSRYAIRARVTFSSVNLYFPLNIIFNYIVGIWDFDTGWFYGPRLSIIPYGE